MVQFSSVAINDLNVVRTTITPAKADPPLLIDADAVLSLSVARQAFQSIAGRSFEVMEVASIMNLHQLAVRRLQSIVRKAFSESTLPRRLRRSVPERLDH
jgi:hypothetical protein